MGVENWKNLEELYIYNINIQQSFVFFLFCVLDVPIVPCHDSITLLPVYFVN
jgi:hypothetical protein